MDCLYKLRQRRPRMTDRKTQKIQILNVLGNDKNIFNDKIKYIIPLYQRAYAWGEKEIVQLIEDIDSIDVRKATPYYIGSLVVHLKDKNEFEVIDGQQRLTTLFLLLNCLSSYKISDEDKLSLNTQNDNLALSFSCRYNSTYSLEKIQKLISYVRTKQIGDLEESFIEPNITNGIEVILKELDKFIGKNTLKAFINKLRKVVIFRIEVPENTDLNRYFEIMNTRGEQLEQHDILKAKLMETLKDNERQVFATVWDACSNMTGYVQMHFNPNDRKTLFGEYWNRFLIKDAGTLFSSICTVSDNEKSSNSKSDAATDDTKENDIGFKEIFEEKLKKELLLVEKNNDGEEFVVRFESIIEFPHFLLHCLKVFESELLNKSKDSKEGDIPQLLDERKLVDNFMKVIDSNKDTDFSRRFIFCLLKCRYLFDKYIIKREFNGDDITKGKWSLKRLHVSDSNKDKAYFKNTYETQEANDNQLMIEAACRVSYTSPKVMHWITGLLKCLAGEMLNFSYSNEEKEQNEVSSSGLLKKSESFVAEAVKNDFFGQCKDDKYEKGVNTPHIVFNFLDYLLWKNRTKDDLKFDFEFRNSVEHWYPQHPSEETNMKWDKENGSVDRFGNLCIIQRNTNSKFSNLSPISKATEYESQSSTGSLKLRLMRKITVGASKWTNEECEKHEKEMLSLLAQNIEGVEDKWSNTQSK